MTTMASVRSDAWRSLFKSFEEPSTQIHSFQFTEEALGAPAKAHQFSFFRLEDIEKANLLAQEFNRIAGRTPIGRQETPSAEKLQMVMQRFHEEAAQNRDLAQWALRIFIANWPGANVLPMPTLRQQLATHHSANPKAFKELMLTSFKPTGTSEDLLAYYRHDIDLSDHHLHWHMLYQFSQPHVDIQGRLFLWMHQQMLARYDTARHMAGLGPVEPFIKWNKNDTWQSVYSSKTLPSDNLAPWINPQWVKSGAQYAAFDEEGRSPVEVNGQNQIDLLLGALSTVREKLQKGQYKNYNQLGADLESSNADFNESSKTPGPHNFGHVILGKIPKGSSVMIDPEVAMTTPVFYQWHRAIDDFGFAWQELQGPDQNVYVIPPVKMRKVANENSHSNSPDFILVPRTAVSNLTFDALQQWANEKFGGNQFDSAPDDQVTLKELRTRTVVDNDVPQLEQLTIDTDWIYVLRLSNDSDTDTPVTVRIWLASADLANNRRNWIEMDKFAVMAAAKSKFVVARPSWHSTVIRRKSIDEPMLLADTKDEFDDVTPGPAETLWCECGLPYRLLLPRGTKDGAPFKFMVMLTDAREDGTDVELSPKQCGSVSFCGKTDFSWPDKKEMGFPFHRPMPAVDGRTDLIAHFDEKPNVVWQDLSIRNESV